jgi:hypothetical protein
MNTDEHGFSNFSFLPRRPVAAKHRKDGKMAVFLSASNGG